jgi:hypothetical protein
VKNKNNIGKVMFLTAVAKPRYGANGDEIFDTVLPVISS